MSVSHSLYAVYGVVVAPPREPRALDDALGAQAHRPADGDPARVRVLLFTVGDSEHTILGADHEPLDPNTYRAVPSRQSASSGTTPCLSSCRTWGSRSEPAPAGSSCTT
ncbi:hypothetical protein GCM10022295_87550 [Streptomyces osmaniensis]|uniref:Uncharacterized protein n=1 Tax=Streptomyces osmaniensis TaxID=593134 RepID=A0ABP6YXJ2_9ACTN|nr:hypothetical protein KJK32_45610 [Streptomyces sp. JCM17656]